jgi:hypothetical protein
MSACLGYRRLRRKGQSQERSHATRRRTNGELLWACSEVIDVDCMARSSTQPVVVLVSEDEPELDGDCADYTVLARDARILEDPRPYTKKVPEDAPERASAVLKRTTVPIAPSNVLGSSRPPRLEEQKLSRVRLR